VTTFSKEIVRVVDMTSLRKIFIISQLVGL